jgi:hypothetical protein
VFSASSWARGWNDAVAAQDDLPQTPPPPAARTGDPDTSQASAGSRRLTVIAPGSPAAALLASFRWGGQEGRTDHEATRSVLAAGESVERFKSVARISTELRRYGLIVDTGQRRNRAMLSRITGDGMEALRLLRDGMAVYP